MAQDQVGGCKTTFILAQCCFLVRHQVSASVSFIWDMPPNVHDKQIAFAAFLFLLFSTDHILPLQKLCLWLTAYVSSCRGAGTAAGPPVLVWGWCHLIRRAAEVTSPLMTPQVLMTTEVSYHNTITEGRMRDIMKSHVGATGCCWRNLSLTTCLHLPLSVRSSQWMCVSIILHFLTLLKMPKDA